MKIYQYLYKVGVPKKYVFAELSVLVKKTKDSKLEPLIKKRYLEIYHKCEQIVKDRKYGLYFKGRNGCGKSYLGAALLREYTKVHKFRPARCTPDEVVDWFTKDYQGMRPRYILADILLIEEMGTAADYDSVQAKNIIRRLLKEREERGKITMYSANCDTDELKHKYGESVMQIIDETTIEFEFPDYDFRHKQLTKYLSTLK